MSKKLTKKQKEKIGKFALANWKSLLVIFLLLVVLLVVAYYLGWIDLIIKKFKDEDEPVLSTAGGYETTVDSFGELKVTFLDVGQADCVIVELPDGKNMIIDSGDFNSDQTVISNFTTANDIDTFHYMLLTHSDRDHVGNMDWVLENYKVNFIFRPNIYSDNDISSSVPETFNKKLDNSDAFVCDRDAYAEFILSAYNEGCVTEYINKDSDFTNKMICGNEEKSYTFEFLTPVANREEVAYSDPNNYSPIFTLEYAGKKIMFNGDAEEEMLAEFMDNYETGDNNIDILKVGHHGSENATTAEFINEIDPEYAVIMCGLGNDYGHPHKKVLDIFSNYSDIEVLRTDCNQTITFKVSSSGNISRTLENSDTTYNYVCGDEMPETLNFNYINESNDFVSKILSVWKDCAFIEKRVI